MTQLFSPELVKNLKAHFFHRNAPEISWMNAVGMSLFLPGVSGFWPGSVQGNGGTPDLTGNGQTMTFNNVTLTNMGLAPVFSLPLNTSYMTTADAVVNSPTTAFFFVAWVYFNSLGATQGIINKWGAAGNRSFSVFKGASDTLSMKYSTDGTAIVQNNTVFTVTSAKWYHIAAIIYPTTVNQLYVNMTLGISGFGASTFNGTAPLEIGRANNGVNDGLLGYMSLPAFGLAGLPELFIRTHYQYTKALFGYS